MHHQSLEGLLLSLFCREAPPAHICGHILSFLVLPYHVALAVFGPLWVVPDMLTFHTATNSEAKQQ